jgi:hypothetical protein
LKRVETIDKTWQPNLSVYQAWGLHFIIVSTIGLIEIRITLKYVSSQIPQNHHHSQFYIISLAFRPREKDHIGMHKNGNIILHKHREDCMLIVMNIIGQSQQKSQSVKQTVYTEHFLNTLHFFEHIVHTNHTITL